MQGLVVGAYGRRYVVELAENERISCVTRGKKNDLACGDKVTIKRTSKSEGVVESCAPRTTLLYRSNGFKTKLFAANVTQVIIVLATQPSFYEALLNRCLIAAEIAQVKPIIVLNKCDLDDGGHAKAILAEYGHLGYTTLAISAKQDISPLRALLAHQTSVLVGQSGMGKSTIINALLPEQSVKTQEVSHVLDSGKHTTTATQLFHLDNDSQIIDSPGLQEFGLNHIAQSALELAFIEFRPYLGHCRFNNCKHLKEPDCAVLNAHAQGLITDARLKGYHTLFSEL